MNHNELTSEIPEIICSELNLKENLTEYIRVLNDKYLYLKIEITRNDSPSIHFRIEGDIEDKNILILYNGAYNGTAERKQKPVFQRSSWIKDLKALSINIDDPTILLGNGCIIGWGQGTLEDYYSLYFNNYLQTIYEVLNISALRNKIHFGSSAGGYQAVVGASLDIGSRAIICNPQIDWTSYFLLSHVDRLRNISFKGFSISALQAMHPDRVNCMKFAKKNRNFPSIDYYVNSQFSHDIQNQLNHFVNEIGLGENQELLHGKEFQIHITHESRGHNPPGKDDTVKLIQYRFL